MNQESEGGCMWRKACEVLVNFIDLSEPSHPSRLEICLETHMISTNSIKSERVFKIYLQGSHVLV